MTNEDTSPGPVQTYLQDAGGAPGRNYKSQMVATGVIYVFSFLLLGLTVLSLHVRCIPHQEFDKTFLSKCVTHTVVRQGGMSPSGKAFLG